MARRNLDEALDRYNSGAGGEFFKLADDGDTSIVRFLHEGDDLEFDKDWFIVHKVEIDKKERWVRCPETSSCPCCKDSGDPTVKIVLQLIEKNDPDTRKIWERGKTLVPTIRALIEKYGDLCNRPYEIERKGKANDTKTKYEFYPMDRDDKQLKDIPVEPQKLLDGKDGYILDLTEDEMEDALDGKLTLKKEDDSRSSRDRGSSRNERDRSSRDSGRGNSRDRGSRDREDSGRGRDRDERQESDRNRDNRNREDSSGSERRRSNRNDEDVF